MTVRGGGQGVENEASSELWHQTGGSEVSWDLRVSCRQHHGGSPTAPHSGVAGNPQEPDLPGHEGGSRARPRRLSLLCMVRN